MKKENFITIFFSIFAIIGIGLLLGGGFWLFRGISFRESAAEVTAKIVDIETYRDYDGELHHRVYVDYSLNGVTYRDMPLNEYSSDMYVGKEIILFCNPDNPGQTMSSLGIYLGSGILLLIGFIFALVGLIPLILLARKQLRQKKLLTNGQILYATVDEIILNPHYTVNGRHPYVIYCSYKDDYRDIIYRFKSNSIWTDPGEVFPPGSYIEVRVDPKDYSSYYVNAEQAISQKIVDYT